MKRTEQVESEVETSELFCSTLAQRLEHLHNNGNIIEPGACESDSLFRKCHFSKGIITPPEQIHRVKYASHQ